MVHSSLAFVPASGLAHRSSPVGTSPFATFSAQDFSVVRAHSVALYGAKTKAVEEVVKTIGVGQASGIGAAALVAGFIAGKIINGKKQTAPVSPTPAPVAPVRHESGAVQWSNAKGGSTFGLALDATPDEQPFDKITSIFPGALTNAEFVDMIGSTLEDQGYDKETTLVATSLCCDEVNRPLETDLSNVFNTNFNMGGLAGFPFGGATSFGAMAAHIPDGGSCAVVFGPHVGVDSTGAVGTVERRGRVNGGSCCGSAVAASGYVGQVYNGEVTETGPSTDALDAQQSFVGSMLMPYAKQLNDAKDKMVELPYALYDAQANLMEKIVKKAATGVAGNGKIAVVGGIQINTPAGYSDYFLPMNFDLYNNKGEKVRDNLLPRAIKLMTSKPFPKAKEVFPGSLSNGELVNKVTSTLRKYGLDKESTLVATSLCCDEVNRPLETDLANAYDTNFQMGGLAGFPFGGATSFGAMAAHIPDGGSCVVVYGPHVGVDSKGAAGTVERRGRAFGGSCCGSAVAASGYVSSVLNGEVKASDPSTDVVDAQQSFVGSLLLPYAQQLEDARDKMVELPYAMYEAQTDLMEKIVQKAAGGVAGKGKIAVLGGIQVNTPPGHTDYFLPKSFNLYNNEGKLLENLASEIEI